jgi:DNA-binding CsgD family transcriptional regulator
MLSGNEREVAVSDLAAVLELLAELHEARDVDDVVDRLVAGIHALVPADEVAVQIGAADPVPASDGAAGTPAPSGSLLLTATTPSRRLLRIVVARRGPFTARDVAVADLLQRHLPAVVAHAGLRAAEEGRPAPEALADRSLTEREREVLALVAAGRTNRDIARALFIQPRTVEKHIENICRKLGASNRAAAAARYAGARPPA